MLHITYIYIYMSEVLKDVIVVLALVLETVSNIESNILIFDSFK